MADKKTETKSESREYIIPLRREWRKVANYRRAGKAARFIKKFIARHMKVPERDVSKVKLDMYLNNEIWFRGKMKPPAKIKVKVERDGDIVRVHLAEVPQHWKFHKIKQSKLHRESEKVKPAEKEEKPKEEKTEEQKKDEKEKETSAAIQKEKQIEQQYKAEKHTVKESKVPTRRLALKK